MIKEIIISMAVGIWGWAGVAHAACDAEEQRALSISSGVADEIATDREAKGMIKHWGLNSIKVTQQFILDSKKDISNANDDIASKYTFAQERGRKTLLISEMRICHAQNVVNYYNNRSLLSTRPSKLVKKDPQTTSSISLKVGPIPKIQWQAGNTCVTIEELQRNLIKDDNGLIVDTVNYLLRNGCPTDQQIYSLLFSPPWINGPAVDSMHTNFLNSTFEKKWQQAAALSPELLFGWLDGMKPTRKPKFSIPRLPAMSSLLKKGSVAIYEVRIGTLNNAESVNWQPKELIVASCDADKERVIQDMYLDIYKQLFECIPYAY